MYNDSINSKEILMSAITVGTTTAKSAVIDISDCFKVSLAFRASTLAGTFVKIEKIFAYKSKDGSGTAVEFASADDFILPLAKMSVASTSAVGKNGLRQCQNIYNSIEIGFISDAGANTVQLTVIKEGLKNEPKA